MAKSPNHLRYCHVHNRRKQVHDAQALAPPAPNYRYIATIGTFNMRPVVIKISTDIKLREFMDDINEMFDTSLSLTFVNNVNDNMYFYHCDQFDLEIVKVDKVDPKWANGVRTTIVGQAVEFPPYKNSEYYESALDYISQSGDWISHT